jgi:hypothetical protein
MDNKKKKTSWHKLLSERLVTFDRLHFSKDLPPETYSLLQTLASDRVAGRFDPQSRQNIKIVFGKSDSTMTDRIGLFDSRFNKVMTTTNRFITWFISEYESKFPFDRQTRCNPLTVFDDYILQYPDASFASHALVARTILQAFIDDPNIEINFVKTETYNGSDYLHYRFIRMLEDDLVQIHSLQVSFARIGRDH